jgi:hypothetical protein
LNNEINNHEMMNTVNDGHGYSVLANKMKEVTQVALMEHGSGGSGGLIRRIRNLRGLFGLPMLKAAPSLGKTE